MSNKDESFGKRAKENGDIELDPFYFNSTSKTVINSEYKLDKPFQKIL